MKKYLIVFIVVAAGVLSLGYKFGWWGSASATEAGINAPEKAKIQ